MANYTIELYDLMKDPYFDCFDFYYDFYTDDCKIIQEFEKKFIEHYNFYEINNPTVYKWKSQLKAKLNLIMPRYKKLYETELAAKEIDFMLNKDLREEFIKEVDRGLVENGTVSENKIGNTRINSKNNTNGNQSRNTNNTSDINNKSSNTENGNATLDLADRLTSVSNDKEISQGSESLYSNQNTSEDKNMNNDEKNNSSSNKNTDEKLTEKTTLISKGNIGVTSSAELLEKWRNTIIDIDRMIIEECRSLFMLVY